jgi:hypothetical protein
MTISPAQQRAAYLGAAVAAAVFVALGHSQPAYLAVGLVLAAALAWLARRGRAPSVAAAAIGVSFGPWHALALLGALYIALAGWIMMRASRLARETREAGPARTPAPEVRKPDQDGRRSPPRSKRYTPPK